MLKFDLLIRRHIFLYLDTKDKLGKMSLVCKDFNDFVYSGYAWNYLRIKSNNSELSY